MQRILLASALGGLCAGVLDIIYAFIVYGPLSYAMGPQAVLQSVAGGWIGREVSMAGGLDTALLGLITHFSIAFAMALVFTLAATRFTALTRRALLWGFVYGLVLYVAMNYVVVPLSAAATGHFPAGLGEVLERLKTSFSELRPRYDADYPWMIPATIFTHTVFVGIPIALAAKRFAPQQA